MNRIILIGNGFDLALAHNLKTRYKDFIDWFWEQTITEFGKTENYKNGKFENDILSINLVLPIHSQLLQEVHSYNDFITYLEKEKEQDKDKRQMSISYKNLFFELITKKANLLKNWVDIEREYYTGLKKCLNVQELRESLNIKEPNIESIKWLRNQELHGSSDINNLNIEFAQVRELLEKYLTKVYVNADLSYNDSISRQIYAPIKIGETSIAGEKHLIEFIRGNMRRQGDDSHLTGLLDRIEEDDRLEESRARANSYIIYNGRYYANPQNTIFLNFNYTGTAKRLYEVSINGYNRYRAGTKVEFINIHGELNNPANPIIFGYGDEMDEDYKRIENLPGSDFLKNMKSIQYSKTGNYRRILNFVEADKYQIYVMGHSCGNSDRTLLSTLFGHDNCVSVKVFYHVYKDEEGNDKNDYTDVYCNISRNFENKPKQRAVVLPSELSEPLAGAE
ncbi:MAG: bacteriophage abortive infection AbiH family protein [Rikenellaceae bacterium]|jgi:hypothetical protein|nr:bacteriophage abortive infection AbiH family protein [Rikenellaceae bacterium]